MTITPASQVASSDKDSAVLRLAAAPPPFTPARRWVLHTASELRAVRAELREEADALGRTSASQAPLEGVTAEKAVLVASELAMNALQHGAPPTILELCEHEGRLLVAAADHNLSGEPRIAGYSTPGHGGFGLKIARQLSVDMGWYRTDEVKVIWAEIGGPHTTV